MTEDQPICPYTGLRSFSEEEALYFKGREPQIDQISRLLEKNKFLMVTGASGEGKSSLIFAGLIPNARAGFFKARYNNWVVADFRPERTPVKNMAQAISVITGNQSSTSETELRRGFASLVDLYKNSDLYIDETSERYKQLSDTDKKARKRGAANLLILVDQFEEFFTNPENFHNGVPSQDSQIVVNLLLETAKITLNENLPVYVVCTMRSDYIGQCSAFRGLPEYIGFSQFFVPRLKRKEIKQVIEEPALLSGNRISQRLIERLVYDLSEGVDQLPILQHALSQIWLVADQGREEMDLIHYAMVGGMPSGELPLSDQQRFAVWFQALPEYHKSYYNETGLNRVIELHANRLYESAWEYYNATNPQALITQRDAKNIIALTFACLTKIDNSRAVRNRMTLLEITHIIHRDDLPMEVVGGVLNVFREEGNSFIRPFKTIEPGTHSLMSDSALDITHESLIRNWGRLNTWATQEYEFYATFLDFKKQMDRWKENGKSSDYLLPIGPLTFFESWYARCKPNAHWINRYLGNTTSDSSLQESARLLSDIQEFLKKSARKVMVSRLFMKYGANRIAALSTMVLMIFLSGFYWFDAQRKKNSHVIENIVQTSQRLLDSKDAGKWEKAGFFLTLERYKQGEAIPGLKKLTDPKMRLQIALEMYEQILELDRNSTWQLKTDLIGFVDESIEALPKSKKEELRFAVERRNEFIIYLSYDLYFHPESDVKKTLSKTASGLFPLLEKMYSSKDYFQPGVSTNLNASVHFWLTFGAPEKKQLQEVTRLLSPWEDGDLKFKVYYPKGTFQSVYDLNIDYGGGYYTLAALYAAIGDEASVQKCLEKLLADFNFFTGTYTFNNSTNLIGYLYQFGHNELALKSIAWISSHTSTSEADVLTGVFNNSGSMKYFNVDNITHSFQSYQGDFFPNLIFLSENNVTQLTRDLESAIQKIKNPSDRDFRLALMYKHRAIHSFKMHYDRGLPQDSQQMEEWLKLAWSSFERVPDSFLNETEVVPYRYFSDGRRKKELTRKQHFIYPDAFAGWLNNTYYSDLFFNYLLKNKDLAKLYTSPADIALFHYWVSNSFERYPSNDRELFRNEYRLPDSILQRVLTIASTNPNGKSFDSNLINLVLANRNFERGDTTAGFNYLRALNRDNLFTSASAYEYLNKTFFYNQLKDVSLHLAVLGRATDAMFFSEKFESPAHIARSYLVNARYLYEQNYHPETFLYLDSTMTKLDKINMEDLDFNEDFRNDMVLTLGRIGGQEIESNALKILGEMGQQQQVGGVLYYCLGLARGGNYYRALSAIPSSFTDEEELIGRTAILNEACEEREKRTGEKGHKELNTYFTDDDYVFYDPN